MRVGVVWITGVCLVALWWAITVAPVWCEEWPALPPSDGDVMIPAQEWPRCPGPRSVKVYVRYPDGALDNVNAETGLMLNLHNWGGTDCTGTADPAALVDRYDMVVLSVDYLQSGPHKEGDDTPYDFGYLQALDALRALHFVFDGLERLGRPFAKGRIYATGGSGGGNVSLMANKLAPRTFACVIDMCGMARLSDDIAFGLPGGSRLNAQYSRDPESPRYLNADSQALRFLGEPGHAAAMKVLGNSAKLIIVHGVTDESCPVEDAREMARNLGSAGLDVEPHFITAADVDGTVLKTTGHALGDRTAIVHRFADRYLKPDSPERRSRAGKTDFEARDEHVRYETPTGAYVISYAEGYPVGRFERR